jgi:[protein-PII] uridylyltransferase
MPRTLQKKTLGIESNLFFFKHTPQDIVKIAKKAKETKEYQYSTHTDQALIIEIYRKVPINIGYLLSTLSHLDVGSMEIFTLFDDIKYFKIEFKKNVYGAELMDVEDTIDAAFDMGKSVQNKNIEIKKDEIVIDCDHSLAYAELKINTKNQIGLLAYVMDIFEKLGINIVSAKIHSTKYKVRDSFLMSKQNNICNNVEKIYELLSKKP